MRPGVRAPPRPPSFPLFVAAGRSEKNLSTVYLSISISVSIARLELEASEGAETDVPA